MMRKIYTALFSALLPIVLLRLYWRGRKAPAYRQRWRERLGYYHCPKMTNVIWLHAVSVGEAEAAFVLIKQLQTRYPDQALLITTTTPTGSARVQAVLGDSVSHVYLPYDIPCIIQRFLLHFQPKLAIIMEKEIWPNLYAACAVQQLPILVINARLSARSAQAYGKIPQLIKPALACISQIAVQTREDQQHFISIGAKPQQLAVLGNIKFDVSIAPETIAQGLALKHSLFAQRFILILASSHQGEEAMLLNCFSQLKLQIPELLLIIVPRHPERFAMVQSLCLEQQFKVVMRSQQAAEPLPSDSDLYIADSIGELKMLYACADIAFVGGSLVAVGGHNVLEPAALGIPVLFGSQMFNFKEIAERMLAQQAAIQCADQASIVEAVLKLYKDPGFRKQLANQGQAFVEGSKGALDRVLGVIAEYLK